jgi:phosphatidylglycerophosphate synthase
MAHITKEFHGIEKKIILPLFFPWFILYSICLRYSDKKFIKNVPNILSVSRIPIAPVSAYLLYKIFVHPSVLAFIIWLWFFGFLAYGDRVDGMIARNCNAISEFGKMIDAGSDKVFFLSHMIPILVSLNHVMNDFNYGIITTTFSFLAVSEAVLVLLALEGWHLRKTDHKITLGANNFGKYKFNVEIATFIISVCMIFMSKAFKLPISGISFYILQSLLIICLVFASLSIYGHIRKNLSAVRTS